MRTCEVDGCDKTHRAQGFCVTHYNQTMPRRHRRDKTCEACGDLYVTTRTDGRFCSLLCRDYTRWGARSSVWPRRIARIPKPKPIPFAAMTRDCAWCGESFTAHRSDNTMCKRVCKVKARKARRRAREVGAPGTYTWAEVIALYLRFDRCCAYCLQRTDAPEPDHVLALSRGGSNSTTNILPSCKLCNSDKRDLTLSEWAADRSRRGLPALPTWAPADDRYWYLTTARAEAHAA